MQAVEDPRSADIDRARGRVRTGSESEADAELDVRAVDQPELHLAEQAAAMLGADGDVETSLRIGFIVESKMLSAGPAATYGRHGFFVRNLYASSKLKAISVTSLPMPTSTF